MRADLFTLVKQLTSLGEIVIGMVIMVEEVIAGEIVKTAFAVQRIGVVGETSVM